ncbi:MerR family transcriptional regulator [Staphylococcus hsinchuensis]|uniref:MerR family transcriptional regulator n=1 Tax=Staphylococcus hsinchuensis TaxID=3051183 RepID=A0ABZ3EFA4_9STAP|nr:MULTISPECIES: MerR family transcriptional regulator [unclassified Staphylococcus]
MLRDNNNYRQYTEQHVKWLLLVKYLKNLDITLNQISEIQNLSTDESKIFIKQYQQKIRKKINELNEIDNILTAKLEYLEHGDFNITDDMNLSK